MLKKNNLGYYILTIMFIIFNIIVFIVPVEKTAIFWIVYTFTIIPFAVQIAVWRLAFTKLKTLKSKFLGFPIIYISSMYLIIQLLVFGFFLVFPTIPSWIKFISCVIIMGVSSICLIAAEIGRDEVSRIESKIQRKVSKIKEMQVDVELIAESHKDVDVKIALQALAEKLKYSDPMSDDSLANIEDEITTKISAMKNELTEDFSATINEIEMLLSERNKKSKLLK